MFVKKMTLIAFASVIFFVPSVAHAQSLSERIMGQVRSGAESGSYDLEVESPQAFAAQSIQIFLGLLATIFFILIIMSGFWLITARGEDEKYEKAMYTIKRAVIGFLVVMASYAIVTLVSRVIVGSTLPRTNDIHCRARDNGVLDINFCSRFTDEQSCNSAELPDQECVWVE